ncbi:AmpG family muropeptide MFS transporter [Betaproteobacteria bacterium PRO7]|jgi:PAT family beta-lactamase induction signal transducer AmpG|nr:AmpG family muropeptide MFS transporter [Betaproteobacteria bacterium PRO7]
MSAPTSSAQSPARARRLRAWLDALRVYAEPPVARMLLLGFSAGLPLLLVFGTLSFWLREAGVDRTTIGFLSWVALAYAFKWAWAPLVDRLPLPWLTRRLGRRRSWLLAAQCAVAAGLVGMALTDPQGQLGALAAFALLTAFASATQDIALDAYRIESAPVDKQAALAAAYQTGYRVAMIWAGAGVLWIAARFDPSEATYEHAPWTIAYLAMAASMAVGTVTVLFAPEPQPHAPLAPTREENAFAARLARIDALPPRLGRLLVWLHGAAISPFVDFIVRYRWHALLLLALIATYRVSDVVMGVMANPFYRDMGFSKDEVAAVSKVYGVAMTLLGAFVGGVLALRIGVLRTLFAGALLSAATNLLFAWLATRGHDLGFLILAVSADNLSAGIASSAFVAYLSGLTNVAYSATQYALFSSVMLLLPKFLAGFSGWAVDRFGYEAFFVGTAALGVPVLLLVWLAARARAQGSPSQ